MVESIKLHRDLQTLATYVDGKRAGQEVAFEVSRQGEFYIIDQTGLFSRITQFFLRLRMEGLSYLLSSKPSTSLAERFIQVLKADLESFKQHQLNLVATKQELVEQMGDQEAEAVVQHTLLLEMIKTQRLVSQVLGFKSLNEAEAFIQTNAPQDQGTLTKNKVAALTQTLKNPNNDQYTALSERIPVILNLEDNKSESLDLLSTLMTGYLMNKDWFLRSTVDIDMVKEAFTFQVSVV